MNKASCTFLAASLMLPLNALAANNNVTFSGTVGATCALTITNPNGVMIPDASLQMLSSRHAGGTAGIVTLTTTGGVTISVDPTVSAISVPAGDASSTAWEPSYSVSGAQTVANTVTSTALTTAGTNTVNVHLTGTKTGSNTFASGTYAATITVKCE